MTPEQRRQRAIIAARSRHTPDDPLLEDQRRALKASRLEDHIRDAILSRPSLTNAQRTRIADVLLATVTAGGDPA